MSHTKLACTGIRETFAAILREISRNIGRLATLDPHRWWTQTAARFISGAIMTRTLSTPLLLINGVRDVKHNVHANGGRFEDTIRSHSLFCVTGLPVVKMVMWSREGLTWRSQVGANPIPIPHPTNLALFGHKIALYSFKQGAHTIAGGSNLSRGLSPPGPLTLTTVVCSNAPYFTVKICWCPEFVR